LTPPILFASIGHVLNVMNDSKKTNGETVAGEVIEALPNAMFRVAYSNVKEGEEEGTQKEVIAYLSGKMRRFRIRVLPGDRVDVLLDGFENEKGRLIKRH